VANIFTSFWNLIFGNRRSVNTAVPASTITNDPIKLYDALDALYGNDVPITGDDTTRRLRTVVNRSVEFYVSKLIPGDKITVTAKSPQVQEAIETVLKQSNFQGKKPAMLRGYALYGDSFIRVRGEEDKVIQEDIKARYVTSFTEDSRGFLTTIRIDIPTVNDTGQAITYTEYWDQFAMRIWEGYHTRDTSLESLGTPLSVTPLADMGIDFIPVVHTRFKDTGELRGQGCTYHALDKIYEANRLATRLNDLQFRHNKAIWAAMANGQDKDGRPLPPPKIKTGSSGDATVAEADKEFLLGDVVYLPGTSDMKSLVAGIDFGSALEILRDQMDEIEQDLPELRYYSLSENQLSGKAIALLLAGAIDRANEARNNFLASLKRINEMSLTIGIYMGIFPSTLGTFDSGAFEHDLSVEEMFSETLDERATTLKALRDGGIPLELAMRKTGWSEEEIAAAMTVSVPVAP
jgi:hypothetical protein